MLLVHSAGATAHVHRRSMSCCASLEPEVFEPEANER